ncbi:hypothetical protein ASE55_03100 [Chryseobacterium sp. Leaf201]|nr:hypothetical protein ASE55_03100 [Chryseobacterium sp. Leaf201]
MFLTEGVPLESMNKMMGHKNISTTQIYAKITRQKISKDMELVSQKFSAMENAFVTWQSEQDIKSQDLVCTDDKIDIDYPF